MSKEVGWKFNLKTAEGLRQAKQAMYEATEQVFAKGVLPEAQRLSPVSPTWPSIPASRGEKRIDKGTNRNSLAVEVGASPQGIKAMLYSQSGHGGYLELGTYRMKARAYMWPAFNKYRKMLSQVLKQKIERITPATVRAIQLKLFQEPPED